jgi:hypothetical protein
VSSLRSLADVLRELAEKILQELPEGDEKSAALKKLDDDSRAFRKMPNEKPPRRQKGTPLSETRDYGKDYMAEYRAEGKDTTYIPKGRG